MRTLFKVVAIALLVGLFAGCRTAPVYNVHNAAIVPAAGKTVSAEQVKKAIIRAGGGLGWVMKDAGDNQLEGTLHLRTHVAKVGITYSPTSYSIQYESSENLNYDGTNIHSNYNGWIQNLQRQIQTQIGML